MVLRRSWLPSASDTAIAFVLGAVVIIVTTVASRWQHLPPVRPLDPFGYLWLLAGAVPLAWRRRAPTTVLALTSILVFTYYHSRYPGGPSVVLPTVALITVTAARGALWGSASAAVMFGVLSVAQFATGMPIARFGATSAGLLLWLIAAVAVGVALRARQDKIQAVRNAD